MKIEPTDCENGRSCKEWKSGIDANRCEVFSFDARGYSVKYKVQRFKRVRNIPSPHSMLKNQEPIYRFINMNSKGKIFIKWFVRFLLFKLFEMIYMLSIVKSLFIDCRMFDVYEKRFVTASYIYCIWCIDGESEYYLSLSSYTRGIRIETCTFEMKSFNLPNNFESSSCVQKIMKKQISSKCSIVSRVNLAIVRMWMKTRLIWQKCANYINFSSDCCEAFQTLLFSFIIQFHNLHCGQFPKFNGNFLSIFVSFSTSIYSFVNRMN